MKKKINITAVEDDQNNRVDSFINKHYKEISRTRIKNLILNESLKINDQIITDPSKKIKKNDVVLIEIP